MAEFGQKNKEHYNRSFKKDSGRDRVVPDLAIGKPGGHLHPPYRVAMLRMIGKKRAQFCRDEI